MGLLTDLRNIDSVGAKFAGYIPPVSPGSLSPTSVHGMIVAARSAFDRLVKEGDPRLILENYTGEWRFRREHEGSFILYRPLGDSICRLRQPFPGDHGRFSFEPGIVCYTRMIKFYYPDYILPSGYSCGDLVKVALMSSFGELGASAADAGYPNIGDYDRTDIRACLYYLSQKRSQDLFKVWTLPYWIGWTAFFYLALYLFLG